MLGATPALAAALVIGAPAPAATGEIVLSVRKPLAFLLLTPTGNVGSTSTSDLIRIVADLLVEHTDLELANIDAALVGECKGKLACFVSKASSERPGAELLLVLSNLTQDGALDRLSVVLVDVKRAQEVIAEPHGEEEDWESELEARIHESAVRARPKWVALANPEETRAFLENVFANDLRRAFDEAGNWEPYGAIELAIEEAGIAIEIDGATAGITRPRQTRITRVPAGRRALKLSHPKIVPYQTEVEVERGGVSHLAPELESALVARSPVESGLFWTGAGLAVAGAVVTAIAVARADSSVETLCVARSMDACTTGSGFQSIGYSPDKAPTFQDDVNPRGILLAPLGYSAFAVGATWSLAAILFPPEDGRFPWIELAAGLAAGALSYGLSAALDGDSFPR